jgi:hypothetical protein
VESRVYQDAGGAWIGGAGEGSEGSEGLSEFDWTIIGRTEASGGEAFGE